MRSNHIAIIGAGLTGLVSAYELSKNGYRVTVFEKSQDIGGLASNFQIQNVYLEKAYHHIFKNDHEIINLINELGLHESLLWRTSSISIFCNGKFFPFSTELDLLKFSPLPFLDRIRLGIVLLYLKKKKHWQKFSGISAVNWTKKWCGNKTYSLIWEPLLKSKFHQYYKRVSMAWLWSRLHIRSNSRDNAQRIESLGYLDGSFNVLLNQLEKKISSKVGCEIIRETCISEIRQRESDKKIVLSSEHKALEQNYDGVIVTTPSSTFAEMIEKNKCVPEEYIKNLQKIDYISALCVIFSTPQSLCPSYWNNINDMDLPFLVIVQHTKLIEKIKYNNQEIYYLGTYLPPNHNLLEIPQDKLMDIFFAKFKEIFPEFKYESITEKHVFKLNNAQHIPSTNYNSIKPKYITPLENVFLANFSQVFPEDRGVNLAVKEGRKISTLLQEKMSNTILAS